MSNDMLWVFEEGYCLRDKVFNFCKKTSVCNNMFEAGSIEALVRIVDENGGYSVIHELDCKFLSPE